MATRATPVFGRPPAAPAAYDERLAAALADLLVAAFRQEATTVSVKPATDGIKRRAGAPERRAS